MQLSKGYFIGVDGGGTKTSCVIGDSSGKIIGTVVGEGSNIKSTKPEIVRLLMVELLDRLFMQTGISKDHVAGIFIGTAGGDREEDRTIWYDWMQSYFPESCHILITNDALPALVSGTFSLNGLVVIAGTGSIAYLVQEDGARTTRSGGWGYLFGDDGSGYHIGNEALRYVSKHYDAFGEEAQKEPLTQAVLQHYNLQSPFEIVTAVYGHENPRIAISSLAQPVLELAQQNYAPAIKIIQQAVNGLVELLSTVFRREKEARNLPIVLCGGLFSNKLFYESFKEAMQAFGNELYIPSFPPVVGSYLNALLSKEIELTPELKKEVIKSWAK